MQAEHTTAPPALPCPLITMCHGWISSWGSCLLRKQARADATAQISKSRAFRLRAQRCSSAGNSRKRAHQGPEVSLTIQAANEHFCFGGLSSPFPPQVSKMTLADWFRAKLPTWFALSWATAQIHIQPISTAWWLPHAFFYQAANADYISTQCKWNQLTSIWWRFRVCTQALTQNNSNAVNPHTSDC